MEQSAWLQKKKSNRWIWILAACVLTLGAIAVFLRNNPELFGRSVGIEGADIRVPVAKEAVTVEMVKAPVALKTDDQASAVKGEGHESSTPESNESQIAAPRSILLPGINCTLLDRGDFTVLVSIEVFFTDDGAREEILTRREELKVMVRSVLSKKTLDQVQTEALRSEIRRSLNTVLGNNPVTDIEFKDFRIEKEKHS